MATNTETVSPLLPIGALFFALTVLWMLATAHAL
jgi:hypothetical protein